MPEGTRWTRPEGGYQLWVELPEGLDTRDLLADAARAGVLFSPGSLFMPDARPSSAMRLTVTGPTRTRSGAGSRRSARSCARIVPARAGSGRTGGMHL